MYRARRFTVVVAVTVLSCCTAAAQDFAAGTPDFLKQDPATLAADARKLGDATRGAIVFHQQHTACTKCHTAGEGQRLLGPDLTQVDKGVTDVHLIESVLQPSKVIKKGFESVTVETDEGKSITGLVVKDTPQTLVLRDASLDGQTVTLEKSSLEEITPNTLSIMPVGQANQLTSRQQFLDLAKYLIEIAEGGPTRALELKPDPALYAAVPLPEYEQRVDHAGMIADLNQPAFKRGEAIYNRLCINCHGTHNQPGSLPTSLKFASDKFKNGGDPYTMYQTLTHGFGLMVPQLWMVPQQKYDVIHYIREAYVKKYNASQYVPVEESYLAGLPKGDTRGPKPVEYRPWQEMNYGPNLIATYEVPGSNGGNEGPNFTYKGIAVRLDAGPGGVSRGSKWMVFDHDTMRLAAAWSGSGFIDWNGINFNGRHGIHPKLVGSVVYSNPVGPGWADPETGSFEDPRIRGRDNRPYGPLPRKWAHYKGLFHHGQKVIVSYTVGDTKVLEMPELSHASSVPVYARTFNIGARSKAMILKVAEEPAGGIAIAAPSGTEQPPIEAKPLVAGIAGNAGQADFQSQDGSLRLHIPAGNNPLRFTLWLAAPNETTDGNAIVETLTLNQPSQDLAVFTSGGPPRWPAELTATATIGKDDGPFAVDTLTHPDKNPWFCLMRLTGFDFYPNSDRIVVSSWDGDVWLVSSPGSNRPVPADGSNHQLTWQRIASGLFQPLGVKIVGGKIYVTCRDQIVILHDLNDDGETDFYENFNNDHQVTEHFHEFAMGLQTDDDGNFYYAKSARHAKTALVPHHGTLLRVSKDGSRTDIVANGFRAANGVCLNPDGTFIVTDQEGHWNPKNRINYVKEGGFYGNMFGYHDVTDSSDEAMEQPLCWITNAFDRSPAELLWVDSEAWGPLKGTLLNLSYGYGQIYVVPHEKIGGQAQGGMCKLPIPRLPTGVMRGRFHPADGQLYTCGMFAWAGNQHKPGGFYRIRYTGQPACLPIDLRATVKGMTVTYSDPLDPQIAADAGRYAVKVWGLKRTASYGSKHYNERPLKVVAATVSPDGKTVSLDIPDIAPTWCMEIKYSLQGDDGQPVNGVVHNSIHQLSPR